MHFKWHPIMPPCWLLASFPLCYPIYNLSLLISVSFCLSVINPSGLSFLSPSQSAIYLPLFVSIIFSVHVTSVNLQWQRWREAVGERSGELMIEYGPDSSRTPADAGLRTSLLKINTKMEKDEGEGRGASRCTDILISNLTPGLWRIYHCYSSPFFLCVSTDICLLQNPIKYKESRIKSFCSKKVWIFG